MNVRLRRMTAAHDGVEYSQPQSRNGDTFDDRPSKAVVAHRLMEVGEYSAHFLDESRRGEVSFLGAKDLRAVHGDG